MSVPLKQGELRQSVALLSQSTKLEDRIAAVCIFSLKYLPLVQSIGNDDDDVSCTIPKEAQELLRDLSHKLSPYFFLEMVQTLDITDVQQAGSIALMLCFQYRLAPVEELVSMQKNLVKCFLENKDADWVEKWQLMLKLCWLINQQQNESESKRSIPNSTMTEMILLSLQPTSKAASTNDHRANNNSESSTIVQLQYPHAILTTIVDDVMQLSSSYPALVLSDAASHGLRALCIQCLHGAVSERLRDETLQALTILLDAHLLHPQWTLSTDVTPTGNFPVFLSSILVGEIRLISEEIAYFLPILAPLSTTSNNPTHAKEEVRLSRDLHALSNCMRLLQLIYSLLLGHDSQIENEIDQMPETSVNFPIWQNCDAQSLLRLRALLTEENISCMSTLLCQLATPSAVPQFLQHRLPLLLHTLPNDQQYSEEYTEEGEEAKMEQIEKEMRLVLSLLSAVKSIIRDGLTPLVLEDELVRRKLLEEHYYTEDNGRGNVWEAMLNLSSLWLLPEVCPVDEYGRFKIQHSKHSINTSNTNGTDKSPSGGKKLTAEDKLEIEEVFTGMRHLWLREDGCYHALYLLTAVIQDMTHTATNNNSEHDEEDDTENEDNDHVFLEKLRDKTKLTSEITGGLVKDTMQLSEHILAPLIHLLVRHVPLFVDFIRQEENELSRLNNKNEDDEEEDDEMDEVAKQERDETKRIVQDNLFLILHALHWLMKDALPILKRLARIEMTVENEGVSPAVSGVTAAFASLFHWSVSDVDSSTSGTAVREDSTRLRHDAIYLVEDALPRCLITVVAGVRHALLQRQRHANNNNHSAGMHQTIVDSIVREVQQVQGMLVQVEKIALKPSTTV